VRYIVGRMPDSGKHLLEAVNKLSEKLDSYDRRITSLELDLSKVQSQVDLSMKSIQVLQKEVAKFHRGGGGSIH
jgi:peptidoglycan hydrolase CwlO-like protein